MAGLISKGKTLVAKSVQIGVPALKRFGQYAAVELVPPKPSEIRQVSSSIGKIIKAAKNGGYKEVPMRDAIRNALVTIEVACWFFIGECIGKRHLIGYNV